MRFRTLLTYGQNFDGVVMYNGHRSCVKLKWLSTWAPH